MKNLKYTLAGIFLGIVFIKGEIISWFRIQEMFRFQSFHMYGIIGTAVIVGMISIWLFKKYKLKSIEGSSIDLSPKKLAWGQVWGGTMFGLGWALTGACPGPLYAQIGGGYSIVLFTFFFAIIGTWVYGLLRDRLPQ